MFGNLNRVEPQMAASAYRTFSMLAPLDSHWRQATCEDVECHHWLSGWQTSVDESTDLGAAQAAYIRSRCGRRFTEDRSIGVTVFRFGPGQRCFKHTEHRVRVERPELFVVRDGDWRGNPTGNVRRHVRADDWVDEFATHQQRLADAAQEG